MNNWGGVREPAIDFDPEYVKGLIKKNGMDLKSVSKSILCMSDSYLCACCSKGKINEDSLLKIVDHFDGDLDISSC